MFCESMCLEIEYNGIEFYKWVFRNGKNDIVVVVNLSANGLEEIIVIFTVWFFFLGFCFIFISFLLTFLWYLYSESDSVFVV